MFILFPVPGYIGKMVQDVQVQRMKMVLVASSFSVPRPIDIQIQDGCPSARCHRRYIIYNDGLTSICRCLSIIFTAVNVLRMIKLFGWERRVSERIRGKRNDELVWLWKLRVGRIAFYFFLPVIDAIC